MTGLEFYPGMDYCFPGSFHKSDLEFSFLLYLKPLER